MKKQWELYYSPLFAQALCDLADFDTKHPSKSDMPLVRSRRENRKGRGGRGGGVRERESGRERNGEEGVDVQRGGEKEEGGGSRLDH